MKYRRTYISVIASFDPDGKIRPMEFIWSDGRKYKIDRVLDVKVSAAKKAGGMGERFTVRRRRSNLRSMGFGLCLNKQKTWESAQAGSFVFEPLHIQRHCLLKIEETSLERRRNFVKTN
jgi:hypothetical protein